MPQGDNPNTTEPDIVNPASERRTCYRCGKPEEVQHPLRLLPGSTHIVVCPTCYEVLWGWKEKKGKP